MRHVILKTNPINGFPLEQPLAGPGQMYRLIEHFIDISWPYDSPTAVSCNYRQTA
jgi:hypothetical protein